jgi:hypothetical protein
MKKENAVLAFSRSGRRDSNPRIVAWKATALPLGDSRIVTYLFSIGYYIGIAVEN